MVQARRSFLACGFYQPILNALVAMQSEIAQEFADGEGCALDLGGGEGYFSAHLASQQAAGLQWYLTDISKIAVKAAAVNFPTAATAVASSFHLPIGDHCVDLVLRNFAPSSDAEVSRILRPNGYFLLVTPKQDHLIELRQLLYNEPKLHAEPQPPEGFKLISQQAINFKFELENSEQKAWLLAMTPMAWRASEAMRNAWLTGESDTVTGHVSLSLYRVAV